MNNFADKLYDLRTAHNMSQESLAIKLNVSRQAITKWETGKGIPDIDNLMNIAHLFNTSIDELVSSEYTFQDGQKYLFESITQYDIREKKHYDITLTDTHAVYVTSTDSEKLTISVASNTISNLENQCKIRIDDTRDRLDINLITSQEVSKEQLKKDLTLIITIPQNYIYQVELHATSHKLTLGNMDTEKIEYTGAVSYVTLDNVTTHCEIDSRTDSDITLNRFEGKLDINQINNTTRVHVPDEYMFTTSKKGIDTSIRYENNGKQVNDYSQEDATTQISINGIHSELIITK
ncbi:helix-turn-helix transcriptional regulator [Alloscardovia theropitheci]|nr:helix-turn-helix transcriptional regulator [Alloscardovia theropitheci]